jgi:hypothetical protein
MNPGLKRLPARFYRTAKSQHLNLKSDTSAKAIPRRWQNGH